jgi:HK97 family phage prohead protease
MPNKPYMPSDSWLREHPRSASMRLEIKGADDASRIITGIASTGEIDRMGDIVSPDGATWKTPIPLLDGHDYSRVIGSVTSLKRTPKGVAFSARVAKVDTPATLRDRLDEVWSLIRQKLLRTVSIGFKPTQWRAREGGQGGLVFEKFEILELSVVAVPANPGAVIQEVAEAAAYRPLSPAELEVERMLAADRAQRSAGIVRRTGRVVKL